jgi:hypothetical protein
MGFITCWHKVRDHFVGHGRGENDLGMRTNTGFVVDDITL